MQAIILNTAHDRVDPVASRTNLDGVIRTAIIRTQGSYKRQHIKFENIRGFLRTIFENISRTFT